MAATLLQPVASQSLDNDLATMADSIIGLATVLGQLAHWAMNILIEENRANNMLVDLPQYTGSPATQMSAADMEQYRTYFGQLQYVCDLLSVAQGGAPPAKDLVLPWARQRVQSQTPGTPGQVG